MANGEVEQSASSATKPNNIVGGDDEAPLEFGYKALKRGLYTIHTLLSWLLKSIVYRIGFWLGFGALAVVVGVPYMLLESLPVSVRVVVAILFTLCTLTLYGGIRIKYERSQESEEVTAA